MTVTRTYSTPSVQMEIVLAYDVILAMHITAQYVKGALSLSFMK